MLAFGPSSEVRIPVDQSLNNICVPIRGSGMQSSPTILRFHTYEAFGAGFQELVHHLDLPGL